MQNRKSIGLVHFSHSEFRVGALFCEEVNEHSDACGWGQTILSEVGVGLGVCVKDEQKLK